MKNLKKNLSNFYKFARRLFQNFTGRSAIEEKRLLFSPKNAILQALMNKVATEIGLEGADGIDANETEKIFRDRKPFAAVEFHHSNVNEK